MPAALGGGFGLHLVGSVGSTGSVWTPGSLGAALALWLDADDNAASIWQNSGGTGAVSASGDPVGQASDKSGLGRHFIQATSTKRLTWQQNSIGAGHSAIRADDVDDALAPAATFQLTGAQTWAITYRLTSVPAGEFDELIDLGNGVASTSRLLCTDNAAYQKLTWAFDFNGAVAGVGISPTLDTLKHSLLIVYAGGGASTPANYTCWLDGVAQTVVATSAVGPYLGTACLANKSDATGPAAVEFGKIVLASGALAGADLTSLKSYLAAAIA
mgnify:CR=1 FL=1